MLQLFCLGIGGRHQESFLEKAALHEASKDEEVCAGGGISGSGKAGAPGQVV